MGGSTIWRTSPRGPVCRLTQPADDSTQRYRLRVCVSGMPSWWDRCKDKAKRTGRMNKNRGNGEASRPCQQHGGRPWMKHSERGEILDWRDRFVTIWGRVESRMTGCNMMVCLVSVLQGGRGTDMLAGIRFLVCMAFAESTVFSHARGAYCSHGEGWDNNRTIMGREWETNG